MLLKYTVLLYVLICIQLLLTLSEMGSRTLLPLFMHLKQIKLDHVLYSIHYWSLCNRLFICTFILFLECMHVSLCMCVCACVRVWCVCACICVSLYFVLNFSFCSGRSWQSLLILVKMLNYCVL